MARAFIPHHITDDSAIGGKVIERSLRFPHGESWEISRTPSAASSTYTVSMWVKHCKFDDYKYIFSSGGAGLAFNGTTTNNGNELYIYNGSDLLTATAHINDPSSWYHIVMKVSSTTAYTYINGVLTHNGVAGFNISSSNTTKIGDYTTEHEFDGYIADVHFVNGQALDATAFAYTDRQTGIWRPKKYTGTFGTDGFHLEFKDNSSVSALGKDTSGNGNDLTATGFAVNVGKNDDSMFDTPTNNFPTLSQVDRTYTTGAVLYDGNLRWYYNYKPASKTVRATMALPSRGKIYMEWENEQLSNNPGRMGWGLVRYNSEKQNYDVQAYNDVDYVSISYGGSIWVGTTNITAPASFSAPTYYAGERSAMAIDCSTGDFWLGKVATNRATTWYANDGGTDGDPAGGNNKTGTLPNFTTATEWIPFVGWHDGGAGSSTTFYANINFGNHEFQGTVPTGFQKLCSNNIPSTTPIYNPKHHFHTLTYTGNASNGHQITGLDFTPDFVWIKVRSTAGSHYLVDSVRGLGTGDSYRALYTEGASVEYAGENDQLRSLNHGGFTLDDNTDNSFYINRNSETYVAWCWKAGGTAVTNNDGTIATQVSANQTAGFSVLTYTGTGADGTIGHGLGKVPAFVIIKNRDRAVEWIVKHHKLNSGKIVYLDIEPGEDGATGTNNGIIGDLDNASTISLSRTSNSGNYNNVNYSGEKFVAYCWAEIPGYSKMGLYTANGGQGGGPSGPFVYTGFKPAWILVKRRDATKGWGLIDTVRSASGNPTNNILFPDLNNQDYTSSGHEVDFLSNGFKVRNNNNRWNTNGGTYIYMAFAEQIQNTPFGSETNAR